MELLDLIYDALDDDDVYGQLPTLIGNQVGARSCILQLFAAEGHVEHQVHSYFTAEMGQFYLDHGFDRMDVWADVMLPEALKSGRACRSQDLQSDADFFNSPFYNDFLRNFGDDSLYCAGVMGNLSQGRRFVIGAHRAKGDVDFNRENLAQLDMISPHFTRMVEARWKIAAARKEAEVAASGLDALGTPMLILEPGGRLSFANASAINLLQAGRPITNYNGRLSVSDPSAQNAWARTFQSAARRTQGRGGSFLVEDAAGDRWHFHVQPHRAGEHSMVMVLINRSSIASNAQATLRELYGLTSAEAATAVAIANGKSAREIAADHDVKEPTIRTHTMHIYAKMNINKLSDLVRIVASLPVLQNRTV